MVKGRLHDQSRRAATTFDQSVGQLVFVQILPRMDNVTISDQWDLPDNKRRVGARIRAGQSAPVEKMRPTSAP